MISILFLLTVWFAPSFAEEEYECGVPSKRLITKGEFYNRIRGGWDVRPHSLPWQVRLLIEHPGADDYSLCGGSLVASKYSNGSDMVITAAHCIQVDDYRYKFVKAEHIHVIVGAHDFSQEESSRYAIGAISVVGHKWYESVEVTNDIALIQLERAIPYTDETRPVCLPKHDQPLPYGVTCVSSGWGRLHEHSDQSTRLQMNTVQIVPHDQCDFPHYPKKHLCTKGHGDICDGDSGGPLACPIDGKFTLFGVVSYGDAECKNSIFASVPAFIRWYERNMKKMIKSQTTVSEEAMETE